MFGATPTSLNSNDAEVAHLRELLRVHQQQSYEMKFAAEKRIEEYSNAYNNFVSQSRMELNVLQQQLQARNEELFQNNQVFSNELKEKSGVISELQQEISNTHAKLHTIETEKNTILEQNAHLETEIEKHKLEGSLEVQDVRNNLAEALRENQELKQQCQEHVDIIHVREGQLEEKSEMVLCLERDCKTYKDEIKVHFEEKELHLKQLSDAKLIQSSQDSAYEALAKLNKKNEELFSEVLKSANSEKEIYAEEKASHVQKLSDFEQVLASQNSAYEALARINKENENRLSAALKMAESKDQAYAKERTLHLQQLSDIRLILASQDSAYETLAKLSQEEKTRLAADLATANSEKASRESEIESLCKQNAELANSLLQLEIQLGDCLNELKTFSTELRAARTNTKNLNDVLQGSKSEFESDSEAELETAIEEKIDENIKTDPEEHVSQVLEKNLRISEKATKHSSTPLKDSLPTIEQKELDSSMEETMDEDQKKPSFSSEEAMQLLHRCKRHTKTLEVEQKWVRKTFCHLQTQIQSLEDTSDILMDIAENMSMHGVDLGNGGIKLKTWRKSHPKRSKQCQDSMDSTPKTKSKNQNQESRRRPRSMEMSQYDILLLEQNAIEMMSTSKRPRRNEPRKSTTHKQAATVVVDITNTPELVNIYRTSQNDGVNLNSSSQSKDSGLRQINASHAEESVNKGFHTGHSKQKHACLKRRWNNFRSKAQMHLSRYFECALTKWQNSRTEQPDKNTAHANYAYGHSLLLHMNSLMSKMRWSCSCGCMIDQSKPCESTLARSLKSTQEYVLKLEHYLGEAILFEPSPENEDYSYNLYDDEKRFNCLLEKLTSYARKLQDATLEGKTTGKKRSSRANSLKGASAQEIRSQLSSLLQMLEGLSPFKSENQSVDSHGQESSTNSVRASSASSNPQASVMADLRQLIEQLGLNDTFSTRNETPARNEVVDLLSNASDTSMEPNAAQLLKAAKDLKNHKFEDPYELVNGVLQTWQSCVSNMSAWTENTDLASCFTHLEHINCMHHRLVLIYNEIRHHTSQLANDLQATIKAKMIQPGHEVNSTCKPFVDGLIALRAATNDILSTNEGASKVIFDSSSSKLGLLFTKKTGHSVTNYWDHIISQPRFFKVDKILWRNRFKHDVTSASLRWRGTQTLTHQFLIYESYCQDFEAEVHGRGRRSAKRYRQLRRDEIDEEEDNTDDDMVLPASKRKHQS